MAFNFNGNIPKEIIYNTKNVAKLIYNGVVVWFQEILSTVTGTNSIILEKAIEGTPEEVKAFGKCEQASTPTPTSPVNISCNNGVIKCRLSSGLPLGYRQVEWLMSDTVIDTGIKTTIDTELEAKFLKTIANSPQYLYWSDSASGGTTNTTAYLSTSGNWRFGNRSQSRQLSADTVYVSIQNKTGLRVKSSTINSFIAYDTVNNFTSENNLRILSNGNATVKIYYLIMRSYSSGTVLHNWIPCVRYDGVYGFYDKIDNTFITNSDATITAGNIIDTFETYAEGTVEKVEINKFDESSNNIEMNKIITASGSITNSPVNFYGKKYMSVKPNTQYIATGRKSDNTISAYTRIFWYDSSKQFISRGTYTKNTVTVNTSPSNAAYARICAAPYDIEEVTLTLQQVQEFHWIFKEGNSETANTATCENLLSAGTYKDEQEVISGNIMRKVGVKVLTGDENWQDNSSNNAPYGIQIDDMLIGNQIGVNNIFGLCSHFEAVKNSANWGTYTNMVTASSVSKTLLFRYLNNTSTLDNFKQLLASQYANGTPVIIVYPLATPTTEAVTGQSLSLQEGTNIIEVAESSLDDLEIEATYYRTKF